MDDNDTIGDIDPETLAKAIEDCQQFQADHWDDIASDPSQAGHDFWLTRNRHGAGFWDGDWPEDIRERLTDAAHSYGTVDLYVGDDGLIYSS